MDVINDEDLPNEIKAKYDDVLGSVKTENKLEFLMIALEHAKQEKNKRVIARTKLALGEYYFNLEKYYDAANYYLESAEMIKELLQELPDSAKVMFMNANNFTKVFARLQVIQQWVISGEMIHFDDTCELKSLEQLHNLISEKYVSFFIENKKFMTYIRQQSMDQFSKNIQSTRDILTHLSSNTKKNLHMILNYLAGHMIATRGFIVLEGERQRLSVLASMESDDELPEELFIFHRVRFSKESLLLGNSTKKQDMNFLPKESTASLCVPIMTEYLQANAEKKNVLLGYIYLETDKLVNNFSEEGLEKCIELRAFLALLLEKHQLKRSASIDKLTGALTRKYLENGLNDTLEYAVKNDEHFSIIMFDLDKFKRVNDKYGHIKGDEVLKTVSKIIRDNLEPMNLFGRFGGEEFIVVLQQTDTEQALIIAEELREKVRHEIILKSRGEVTISMGIATYPENGRTAKELVEKADQALYVAKESGRNNCRVWNNDFIHKIKPANKVSGIIGGDEIKDARTVLAIVELIELTNKKMPKEDKIYDFLGRSIEILEAKYGFFLYAEDGKVIQTYGREMREEIGSRLTHVNENVVRSVMKEKQGTYLMTWDEEEGLKDRERPNLESIVAAPVIKRGEVKGLLYFASQASKKEYGANELNLIEIVSDLFANLVPDFIYNSN